MHVKIIEAEQGDTPGNWGKFAVMRPGPEEWKRSSAVSGTPMPLLREIGWGPDLLIVFDLQTREGAAFRPGGHPGADLTKHRIWVCPLFEAFLGWLYRQPLDDLNALPDRVALGDVPFAFYGYRRPGPEGDTDGADG